MENTEQQIEEPRIIITYDENGLATILLQEYNDIRNTNIPSSNIKEIKLLSNALSDTDSKYITKLTYIENKLKDLEKIINKLPTASKFDTLYNKVSRINDYIYELKNPKTEDSEETKKFLAEQKTLNNEYKENLLKTLKLDELNNEDYEYINFVGSFKTNSKFNLKEGIANLINEDDKEKVKESFSEISKIIKKNC